MYLEPKDPDAVNAPIHHSFDDFFWNNLPFHIQHNNGPYFSPNVYMTDYLSHETSSIIRTHTKVYESERKPFFINLCYNAPHDPLQALKSDYDSLSNISDHKARVYAAMIKSIDRGVGEVLDTLREVGEYENTIVMFTSDNGGAHYLGLDNINSPYRGWKATYFEGGVR